MNSYTDTHPLHGEGFCCKCEGLVTSAEFTVYSGDIEYIASLCCDAPVVDIDGYDYDGIPEVREMEMTRAEIRGEAEYDSMGGGVL